MNQERHVPGNLILRSPFPFQMISFGSFLLGSIKKTQKENLLRWNCDLSCALQLLIKATCAPISPVVKVRRNPCCIYHCSQLFKFNKKYLVQCVFLVQWFSNERWLVQAVSERDCCLYSVLQDIDSSYKFGLSQHVPGSFTGVLHLSETDVWDKK